MKKICAIVTLMLAPLLLVSAISVEDFNNVVDFSISLKSLNEIQDLESIEGRFVIVSGEVSARQVIDGSEDTFLAELEIVDGEWKGAAEVLIYKCIVVLEGPEFVGSVPARRSRTKDPREIGLNTTLLVVAEVLGFSEAPDGSYIPVIKAVYLRGVS